MSDEENPESTKGSQPAAESAPPPSAEEVPLSTRDVELEPVSLRDIAMILAPGKAPPPLARNGNGHAAAAKRREDDDEPIALEHKKPADPKEESSAGKDSGEEKVLFEPKRSQESVRVERAERAERAEREAPKDSAMEDLRLLAASVPPPPGKQRDVVDLGDVMSLGGEAPPPPLLPPDLSQLLGEEKKDHGRPAPKPPLKKRDAAAKAKTETNDDPPRSERPRSSRPKTTTAAPARSVGPTSASRPPEAARVSSAPKAEPRASGAGSPLYYVITAAVFLGIGYFMGRGTTPEPMPATSQPTAPAPRETAAAATNTAGASVPAPAATTATPVPEETAAPSASAAPTAPALTGSLPTSAPTVAATGAPTVAGPATPTATASAKPSGGEFDKTAASAALGTAIGQAAACKQPGDPSGTARVSVTFAPSGRVTVANVAGPPFAGTATGSCIARAFKTATVPAFSGDAVTVSKTVNIP